MSLLESSGEADVSPRDSRIHCTDACHAECLACRTHHQPDPTLLAPVRHRPTGAHDPQAAARVLSLPPSPARRNRPHRHGRHAHADRGARARVGIVACLQTHGSRANWHPHLHLLVTDGGFRPGTFVSWPAHDTARLTEAFRRAVLRLFVRLELFD